MSTKYIASNWRLPNQENSSKNDNYGLTFDGSNEYINCGTPSTFAFGTGDFSISSWVYLDSSTGYQWIFSTGTNFAFGFDSSRNLQLWVGVTATTPSFNINLNQWHHVVATRNSGTVTFYIDGVAHGTTYTRNGSISSGAYNYIGTFNIGQNHIDGSISQVSIYDYALTSTQISTLYGSSSLGSGNPMALKPQPVAYYPLGDNSASNPLTQPNVAVEDATVFDFDGSDDYVNLNTTLSSLGVTTSFSISTWVNISTLGIYDTVIGAPAAYGTWNDGFGLMVYNNALYFWVEDWNDANHFVQTATLNTSQWYHIVCTFSTSNGLKIYVDSGTPTTASNTEIGTLTFPMFIGSTGTNTTYVFNGEISNTQIWNTELSASDVTTLYNSGVPLHTGTQPQAANLKSWYKLNNTANWEADSSGNWQIPEATSAYPQSFDFDGGNNDYINCGNNILQDLSNSGTIDSAITFSMWFKLGSSTTSRGMLSIGTFTNSYGKLDVRHQSSAIQIVLTNPTASVEYTYSFTDTSSWHNLVIVYDPTSASNSLVYIDGVQAGSNITDVVNLAITSQNLYIGAYYGNSDTFTGQISNVQCWNSSLPATGTDSVETLYNNGSPLTTAIESSNLKAWYKLDNSATFSTNWSVPDASGNGNTGTSSGMTEQNLVNNNVSTLNGESSGMTSANLVLSDLSRNLPYDSYSFNFDSASSDYIDCGDSDTFSFGNGSSDSPFSISFWYNPTTIPASFGIIAKDNDASNREWTIGQFSSNNKIRFLLKNNGGGSQQSIDSTTTLSTGQWYHIMCTYNGVGGNNAADGMTIYINGVVETPTNITKHTYTAMANTTAPLTIGTYQLGGTPLYTDGKISNLSIFNEELTSTEVLKLYANGVPQDLSSFTPQPVAWYPLGSNSFWNGSAWTCRDMSAGGSNDGTSANIGADGLVGDAPRSEANGTGTNMDVPSNLEGNTKWSSNNSYSVNMSSLARVEDVA